MVWGHQQSEKDQPFPKADFDDLQLLCVSLPVYPSWLCFHKRQSHPRHPRNSWGTYYEKSHLSHMKRHNPNFWFWLGLNSANMPKTQLSPSRLFASKVLSEKKNSSPLTTTSTIRRLLLSKLMIPTYQSLDQKIYQLSCTQEKISEPLRSVLRCDMQRQVQGW